MIEGVFVDVVAGLILTIIFAIASYTWARSKKLAVEIEAVKQGLSAVLRTSIINCYNVAIKKGYCRIHNKDNSKVLYESYIALVGSDDTVKQLIDEIMTMSTDPEVDYRGRKN